MGRSIDYPDGEVNRLSQQVYSLSLEKDALAEHLVQWDDQLAAEVLRRKVLEADLARVLQKGVVFMVDRVVESSEFVLGIRCVKVACVAAARSVEAMQAAIKAFSGMDFASYLCLGKLSRADLRRLCFEEEEFASDGGPEGVTLALPRHN
ncbi:unnamed protein product [Lactuca saligna]|uniref:Uncharacterized protein n=1 Tax=Lactuca saligna TaxID=75948 RepID=A0AA35VL88_LACSI|nr:unnamed protein product [Lactuca saligna]